MFKLTEIESEIEYVENYINETKKEDTKGVDKNLNKSNDLFEEIGEIQDLESLKNEQRKTFKKIKILEIILIPTILILLFFQYEIFGTFFFEKTILIC